MKSTQILFTWLAVVGLALATAGTASAQDGQRTAEVVRLKGSARYSTDGGTWQPLKIGTMLSNGAVIQTAEDSNVDVVFSEGKSPVRRPRVGEFSSFSPTVSRDVIRIQADSVMAIDKMTATDTGADKITETQVDLRSGSLAGAVRKVSAASTFEIKIPNGVAGIRGTLFAITALGVIQCWEGSLAIAIGGGPDGPKVEILEAGYQYDIRTGQITPVGEQPPKIMSYAPGQPMLFVISPFTNLSGTSGSTDESSEEEEPPIDTGFSE
jgi:hypothetical protein